MSQDIQDITDVGGATSALLSVFMFVAEKLSIADINQWLITITSLCGIVWVVYKIRGQHLDNKNKKLDSKIKEKELGS